MKQWKPKTYLGLAAWLLLLGGGAFGVWSAQRNQSLWAGFTRLQHYWLSAHVKQTAVVMEPITVMYRDPVFSIDPQTGEYRALGQITSPSQDWTEVGERIEIRLHDANLVDWQSGHLEFHQPERNLGRVIQVMLTPDRLQRLTELGEQMQRQHEQEVIAELSPIFQKALTELRPVIEQEFRQSIANHQNDIQQLTEKYKQQIVKEKVLPLVETEVLPVVQKHAQPLLEEIGGEMWREVSVFRFAWRYLYDESWGPNEPLVQKEWQRFVDNQALPILRNHSDDFIQVQGDIISELANNPRVKEVIQESLNQVATDPEAKKLVRDILSESLTKNETVRVEMQRILQSPETQLALKRVGDRFEPYAVQIGQELFGSPEKVNREFALVLRHMILRKDQQWIVWVPGKRQPAVSGETIGIYQATEIGMPPFFQQSPVDSFNSE